MAMLRDVRTDRPEPARATSAVSQALRAIQDEVSTGREVWPVPGSGEHTGFRILVASDRTIRERAYALAYRVYRRAGYAAENESGLCVAPYDASCRTLTLLAQDFAGNDLATVSLVFDSQTGLPCDEIYGGEAGAFRAAGFRLAEVTRLAIEATSGAKELLLHLFNQCYIFARMVGGVSDLLIEVNPRHVSYYQRLLHFEKAGPVRQCARVRGAPAVLLRLNFAEIEATVKATGCVNGRDLAGRRLHAYPYSRSDEEAIAQFLARSHRPMTAEDAGYFRLLAPGAISNRVFAAAK